MDTLKIKKITQDQAWQRCGRAGRDSEGFCYRTYTFDEYKQMQSTTMPEILRSNIAATVIDQICYNIYLNFFLIELRLLTTKNTFTDTSIDGTWN